MELLKTWGPPIYSHQMSHAKGQPCAQHQARETNQVSLAGVGTPPGTPALPSRCPSPREMTSPSLDHPSRTPLCFGR